MSPDLHGFWCFFGGGGTPKIKKLLKIDFLKKKLFGGRGLKTEKKNSFKYRIFEEKNCLGGRELKTKNK